MEALAVQLTQREGELFIEKAEVKKLASFLKQVKGCCFLPLFYMVTRNRKNMFFFLIFLVI